MNTFNFKEAKTGLIVGAGSTIGQAISEELKNINPDLKLYQLTTHAVDESETCLTVANYSEEELQKVAPNISEKLSFIIILNGQLHRDTLTPEKSVRSFTTDWALENFMKNALVTPMVAKVFGAKLETKAPSVFVAFSAKVGSLSDNQVGGWHSYRAAKAALNMYLRCIALEWKMSKPKLTVAAYHPGTVDSPLSKPFHAIVKHEIFTPKQAAEYFLSAFDGIEPKTEAIFMGWDKKEIAW
jgi:NAD(P)-dependent dehydrogenase (short-subunit alcohol dehydrogenase family)